MNRTALSIILCAPLCAGGIERDKQMHAAAGAIAYVAVYEVAKHNDMKHPKTHTCDAKDTLATFIGGFVVSWVWRF